MALALELGSNSQFCQHVPCVSMRSENMTLYKAALETMFTLNFMYWFTFE